MHTPLAGALTRLILLGPVLMVGVPHLFGCPGKVERRPTHTPGPAAPESRAPRAPLPGPSKATCDPATCPVFCFKAACGVDREACEVGCRRVCGDGYFDDRDGPVMACTLGARGDACAALERCCGVDYTSQLCELAPIAR